MTFDGTWNVVLRAPQGAQDAIITLSSTDSSPVGTMQTDEGVQDLLELAKDNATLTWKVPITKPMPLTLAFTAAVDADQISGTAKVGALATIPFDGTRSA